MKIKKKSWNDITITDWKRMVEIYKDELASQMEKDIAVLAILCDVPEDELYALPVNELALLLSGSEWLKQPFKFDERFNSTKIKIDGETYTVNPDINNFTVAQYMDYQTFWERKDEYMGNLLAVFIIPQGHKYNEGYDVMALAKKLEDTVSIAMWNSVCFFFLRNWLNSIKGLTAYSLWMTRKMRRKEKDRKKKEMLMEKEKELKNQLLRMLPIG